MFKRPIYKDLLKRLREPRRFLQMLAGARQTGKTTLVRQVLEDLPGQGHYATADEPTLKDRDWIEQQWEAGRQLAGKKSKPAVLVLDEIQKIPGWSETVKRLWDADTAAGLALHVVVLGSAPLLVQSGLSESLAGRFEIIPVPHWSLPQRWRRYILDSLVETTISRDILLMRRVDKPALLRRLFELGCQYSGQVLSYNKMLGQLQDAGNTTTLAHYLELLQGAALLEGLQKYAGQKVRRRGSSPKFQVHNNALITAQSDLSFEEARANGDVWGRLVESAVGMWLVNAAKGTQVDVHYWSAGNHEVDFVLVKGAKVVAVEVKSRLRRGKLPGMAAFAKEFKAHRKLLVGADGIPIEEFLTTDVAEWF